MKSKLSSLFFAVVMMFSIAFVGEISSNKNPYSAEAQTVRVKKKRVGAIRYISRGGKYVGRQVWSGTKWVGDKSWKGTKYAGKKVWNGTKWVGRRIY